MKILVAHNSYCEQGGEDVAVNAEIDLLRNQGHEVEVYRRFNSEIQAMSRPAAAVSTIWSQQSVKEIGRICDSFQPDLIHGHNTFPLISPSLFWLTARRRIAVVQTLHNFRLLCPQAMFLREGKICEDCLGKLPWRAVTRKCYQQSALTSAVAATMLTAHQVMGTYRQQVTAFIALNAFGRDKFIAGGLPAERIYIKPNFVDAQRVPDWHGRSGGIFVGRLASEKGLDVLIQAVSHSRDTLRQSQLQFQAQSQSQSRTRAAANIKVVGAGPLESAVRAAFGEEYLGYKTTQDVLGLLATSLYLVAPSTCYESFGLSALEAFSCGVAVIASRHGGLGELVTDGVTGLLFNPGDALDLAEKIAWAQAHPQAMLAMGRAAYAEYLRKYTPQKNYRMLMSVYQSAILQTEGVSHAA